MILRPHRNRKCYEIFMPLELWIKRLKYDVLPSLRSVNRSFSICVKNEPNDVDFLVLV